jgi:2-polyprenyl-3-methyl-5-hydroxy-6-metoxy-1,4-benzoquinol methylase
LVDPVCRFCAAPLAQTFVDLGMSPASNAFLSADELSGKEPFYPLHALVCGECYLVQLQQFQSPQQIFGDYAYFSSYSDSWLEHARAYAAMARERFRLSQGSMVVEIASNDGYLLQYFRAAGVPVLGIEPARNVAAAAEAKGIPTLCEFFGRALAARLAADGRQADLLVGNNVLAHVPDLNDFVAGLKTALKAGGAITLEFPHLLELIEYVEFDTIYHEHFSYFSLLTAEKVMAAHGLAVFDVDTLPTHGGSLRLYVRHAEDRARATTSRVEALRAREKAAGMDALRGYADFDGKVKAVKRALLDFLEDARASRRMVAGYGAPAKATTLLNYCGIGSDLLPYTVDRSPHKQGRFIPGAHIPIRSPDHLLQTQPAYVLILPWNIKDEIVESMAAVRDWGGRFVVPVPMLKVL